MDNWHLVGTPAVPSTLYIDRDYIRRMSTQETRAWTNIHSTFAGGSAVSPNNRVYDNSQPPSGSEPGVTLNHDYSSINPPSGNMVYVQDMHGRSQGAYLSQETIDQLRQIIRVRRYHLAQPPEFDIRWPTTNLVSDIEEESEQEAEEIEDRTILWYGVLLK